MKLAVTLTLKPCTDKAINLENSSHLPVGMKHENKTENRLLHVLEATVNSAIITYVIAQRLLIVV